MFKKVLVGVDGQSGGDDAVALARQLVAKTGELLTGHVRPIYPTKFEHVPEIDWHGSTEPAPTNFDDNVLWTISTSIGRGLHDMAEQQQADLLVVGSSRRGIIGRVMTGDGTQESINGAPCAVAIAPAGYAQHAHKLRSVGVAYNASPESEHAITVARQIAAEHHAVLSATEVVNYPTYAYIGGGGIPLSETTQPLIDSALRRVEALAGVAPHAAFGSPAEELARYSGTIDLLIVGSRGYGPIGRLVHSSVSRQLARSSRCPLLILTRGARRQDQHVNVDVPEVVDAPEEATVN